MREVDITFYGVLKLAPVLKPSAPPRTLCAVAWRLNTVWNTGIPLVCVVQQNLVYYWIFSKTTWRIISGLRISLSGKRLESLLKLEFDKQDHTTPVIAQLEINIFMLFFFQKIYLTYLWTLSMSFLIGFLRIFKRRHVLSVGNFHQSKHLQCDLKVKWRIPHNWQNIE